MHEFMLKCVTKSDSQDGCFNGYPITDTTDQWSPIFAYQRVYLNCSPNLSEGRHTHTHTSSCLVQCSPKLKTSQNVFCHEIYLPVSHPVRPYGCCNGPCIWMLQWSLYGLTLQTASSFPLIRDVCAPNKENSSFALTEYTLS